MGAVDDRGPAGARRRRCVRRRDGFWRRAALPAALALLVSAAVATGAAATSGSAGAPPQAAPAATAQAELYAWDAGPWDMFGRSAAVSGDTALVGAPLHSVGDEQFTGAVYVFTCTGGVWTATTRLTTPGGGALYEFGAAVAFDGEWALVGAPGATVGGADSAGAVFVFTRTDAGWTPQARLVADDRAAGDDFGCSLALDGTTAVIGALGCDVAGHSAAGAAYVFTLRSRGEWAQAAKLTETEPATDACLGAAVAVAGDTALVASTWHATAGLTEAGAVDVFTRSGGEWTLQGELTDPAPAAGDQFGMSLGLLGDTALVGEPFHDAGDAEDTGAVHVFERAGDVWTQSAELADPSAAAGDDFGYSMAVAGERALVGAPGTDSDGLDGAGAAYVLARSAGAWAPLQRLEAPAPVEYGSFGGGAALDGATALVGAPFRRTGGFLAAGAAYILATVPRVTGVAPDAGPAGTTVTVTGDGLEDATAVAFGGIPAVFTADSGAQVTARVPAGAVSGPVTVTTVGGTAAAAEDFTVLPVPAIAAIRPAAGRRGAQVTVAGTGFGAERGASVVTFGATACSAYRSWSDTRVVCRVPARAAFGRLSVTVTTGGGTSNAKSFRVKR